MKTAYGPTFWLLCIVGLLAFITYDLIRSPLLPLFAGHLGAGPEGIGLIVGISTVTGILFKLPSGTLSDRLGRRRLLLAGLLVFAIAPYLYFWVKTPLELTVLRAFHGLATAVFAPVAMAVVADLAREGKAEALSWYGSFTQAGRLSGRMIGGYLLLGFGFYPVFGICAVVGIVMIGLFWALRLPGDSPKNTAADPGLAVPWHAGLREIGRDRRILSAAMMEGANMTASGALMAFLPLYGMSVGLNAGEVGLLFGAMGLSSIIAKPFMGRLSDRIGRQPMIASGQLICAVVMAAVPWIGSFPGLLLLSLFFGFGEAVIGSSTSARVADLCRQKSLGAAMGVFGTIMDIGHACGPILTGILIGRFGYMGAFLGVGGLLIGLTLLFGVMDRRPADGAEAVKE